MQNTVRWRLLGLFLLAAALLTAYSHTRTEVMMANSARNFLDSLSAEQKYNTLFDFGSDRRTEWHFFPDSNYESVYGDPRPGISYNDMSAEQARLAEGLLAASLSRQGMIKALEVMSLEEILRVLEQDDSGRRDVNRYYYAIFGDPGPKGFWGWRIEGHHLSLNYTIKNGKLVSASPMFFGGNPHEVLRGPRKGLRVLAREEDLARKLVKSLDPVQRKQAVVADTAYDDILTVAGKRAKLEDEPPGLAASELTNQQLKTLMALIEEYASSMPEEVAARRMKLARETPLDELRFAWAGGLDADTGDYYRVQAPEFLIEYDNTQNNSNHSHTVWRDFDGDFGFDVLAAHHRRYDHGLPGGAGGKLAD